MCVVEPARAKVALACLMQSKKLRVAVAWLPCPRIDEQIHFAREPCERCHREAAAVIFENQLRNENRVLDIREGVVESLSRVDAPQFIEIRFFVFANKQRRAA